MKKKFIDKELARWILRKYPRQDDVHKGQLGHTLLISGSWGMAGSAVLSSFAALRAGAGKVSVYSPKSVNEVLQEDVPEAMVITDPENEYISELKDLDGFDAYGIGPGIGTRKETQKAFQSFLRKERKHMVIDADGLNILSETPESVEELPENTILTPHIGEFTKLFGGKGLSKLELETQQKNLSIAHKLIIVLKDEDTTVTLPDGSIFETKSGSNALATAGTGDVLLGIIASLVGQGFLPKDAALFGVYLHGLAGEQAEAEFGNRAVVAGDVIENIGRAYISINTP